MMSSNRGDYKSAAEWLSALKQDEAWLSQQQRLQTSAAGDANDNRDDAIRRIGKGETFEFWEIYCHKVEPVVSEVWEIAELSLPKLKIQTIGMLSMEWLDQHTRINNKVSKEAMKPVTKNPEKPAKPREAMTFGLKSGVTDGHLNVLYQRMVEEEWIEGNEANFYALFSGKRDEDCELTWLGKFGKGTLVELFKIFAGAKVIEVPKGFSIPSILEGHFKDTKGKWLTGLDKGDKANCKASSMMYEFVKILQINLKQWKYGDEDIDEDFREEYDLYDHQDLHLHSQ